MKSRPLTQLFPLVLAAILIGVIAADSGSAFLAGQPDAGAYGGCGSDALGAGCHSTAPAAEVTATVTGFPTTYQPGKTYTVTVTGDGGPESQSAVKGGFFFQVTGGKLTVPGNMDGKVQLQSDDIATHTPVGARQRAWAVEWTAPSSGLVNAKVFVNTVNGDGTNSPEDHWSSYQGTSFSANGGATASTPGLGILAVLGAALALVAIRRR